MIIFPAALLFLALVAALSVFSPLTEAPQAWAAEKKEDGGKTKMSKRSSKILSKKSKELLESGLFKINPNAVRGVTARGQTILDAPAFEVLLRAEDLEAFPCSDCHEDEPLNRRERVLEEDHEDLVLDHGSGRFWCITCHGSKTKDTLTSLKGKPIDFDKAYLLCGQCHFERQKDWYFGGHGKRLENWNGKRILYSCPQCHDPHSPSIKPFKPAPPPKVRKGLKRRKGEGKVHLEIWKILEKKRSGGNAE